MNKDIEVFNQLLKGLYQVIRNYDVYIQKTQDDTTREILQKMQKKHNDEVTKIVDLIQQLKGNPINSAGLSSSFEEFKRKILGFNSRVLDLAMQDEERLITLFDNQKDKVTANNQILIKDFLRELKSIVKQLYLLKENQSQTKAKK